MISQSKYIQSLLTLAASSVHTCLLPPPSSRKSGAVGTETGRSGERAFPAWPRDAVLVDTAMDPGEDRHEKNKNKKSKEGR